MTKEFEFDDIPPVKVTDGYIKGYYFDGTYIFKGIPYAQARRFHMPEKVTPWSGVKNTTTYGYVSPLMSQDPMGQELTVPHRYWLQDENCLNLNIWTPNLDHDAKRPVLVWLHGGGYITGSSIEQVAYDGKNMSSYGDVVVVSINHRLNVLGYLDLSSFGEQYTNSGNAGHADLVAALLWIQENIISFGGDLNNVTLFGQSGGGMKIADLMQIPAADGLYNKALIMSGSNEGIITPICYGSGEQLVKTMLKDLGIEKKDIEKLESVPYARLVEAYMKVCPQLFMKGEYFGGAPVKSDYFYGVPLRHGLRTQAYEIPLMIGSVMCEFDSSSAEDRAQLSKEQLEEKVAVKYGTHANEIIKAFKKAYPDKNPIEVLGIDRAIRQTSVRLAKMHAEGKKAGTYLYNFTLEFPFENKKPAWHCSDIPFVFHNIDKVEVCNILGVSNKLEREIFNSFIAFAKTGNPNNSSIPEWASVTDNDVPTMIFDKQCEVRHNYDDELFSLIDSILPPFSFLELLGQNVPNAK